MKTFRYLIAGLLLLAALPSQSKEEEISVSRSWGKLSGTLTVPDEGSDAAVLIIAGSGPTDRNGNSGSGLITNTYYMLARALEKEGIASLRYDKQGIGGQPLPRSGTFTNRKTGCAWPTTSPTPKP